jgi:hypothetical protein
MGNIQIISNASINKQKWDRLVFGKNRLYQGNVFASYEYLNAMAEKWYGVVLGDYVSIMPLICKKKNGFHYFTSLAFGRQLGLIGDEQVSFQNIINKAIGVCKYGDLIFNDANYDILFQNFEHFKHKGQGRLIKQPNFLLPLDTTYEKIWSDYATVLKRKIRKAKKSNLCFVMPGITSEPGRLSMDRETLVRKVIAVNRHFLAEKMGNHYNLDHALNALEVLMLTDFGQKYFFPCAVLDNEGTIQMMDVYAIDHRRVYKMLSVVVNNGRALNAMAFGVDAFFQLFERQPYVFDFMGSSIPSVRAWVEDFGAKEQPNYVYRYNALPWPINLLKSI